MSLEDNCSIHLKTHMAFPVLVLFLPGNHQRIDSFRYLWKWMTSHTLTSIKMFSGNLLIVFLKVILFSYRAISLDKKRIRKKTRYMCWKGQIKVLLVILLNSDLLKLLVVTSRLCDYVTAGNIKSLRLKVSYHQILEDSIFYIFCFLCCSFYHNDHLHPT